MIGYALVGIKTVMLLSYSGVKIQALLRWLKTKGVLHVHTVVLREGAPTHCPQPVGQKSAIECLMKRLPDIKLDRETLYLGIENFIDVDAQGRWTDYAAVCASFFSSDGLLISVSSVGIFGNYIPPKYAPTGEPDIDSPLGYQTTVGQRIHAARPRIPHDNWGASVAPLNVDRVTQIFDALRGLDGKIRLPVKGKQQ